MGKCRTCSRNAGFLFNECQDCANRREQKAVEDESRQTQEAAAALAAAREKAEAAREKAVAAALADIKEQSADGTTVFLYDEVYVPVDESESLDLILVREYGRKGWEVISTIPVTKLLDNDNPSYNGGNFTGGNVCGVHILFRLVVAPEKLEAFLPTIEDLLKSQADELVRLEDGDAEEDSDPDNSDDGDQDDDSDQNDDSDQDDDA